MAMVLVDGGAGVTGDWVDVHPCAGKVPEIRVTAVGGYSVDVVTIQHALKGFESDPITLGTLSDHSDLIIDEPVEQIRAVVGGSVVGTAKVYAIVAL